jgi:alpha-ketoglutaric semialdehyde dehydrogenase
VHGVVRLDPPNLASNWIDGGETPAASGKTIEKISPIDGSVLCKVPRSDAADLEKAISPMVAAQRLWESVPGVERGNILYEIAQTMHERREEISRMVSLETGKSLKDALAETNGALLLARFAAGEGQRLYGRTTTSSIQNRLVLTIRQARGIAGLIVSANTPIANIAWKVFPALICGNGFVLKPSEDAPLTAWLFGKILSTSRLPKGSWAIVQGLGSEAGDALVRNPQISVVSFTGSTAVGRKIASVAGERLARLSLELGGKNALVVCEDADLEQAAQWAILSAFSNAGQRCASGSRVIVLDTVYEKFKALLVERTSKLRLGPQDSDDLGPVINEKQMNQMLAAVEAAQKRGATILCGGSRLTGAAHAKGYYVAPTWLENIRPTDEISSSELFGPISILYKVRTLDEAIDLLHSTPYGLTSAIHTRNIDQALAFSQRVKTGVVSINAGTYGSEPHLPFGGFGQSGNGSREPGTEALDVYSELKNVYLNYKR